MCLGCPVQHWDLFHSYYVENYYWYFLFSLKERHQCFFVCNHGSISPSQMGGTKAHVCDLYNPAPTICLLI
jgi:hypothetical protein